MATARLTSDTTDDIGVVRREAAAWRTGARDAEQAATEAEGQLDAVLALIVDRVIDGLRERGWVEFHREAPADIIPADPTPTPTTEGPHP